MGGSLSQKQVGYQIDLNDTNFIKHGPFILANGIICVPMLVRHGVFIDQFPQWLEGKISEEQYHVYIEKINDSVQEESLKINRDFLKHKPHPLTTEKRQVKLQSRLKHNKHNLISNINAVLMEVNKVQEGMLEFRCCGADPRGRMSGLRIDQYLEYVASVFLLVEVVDTTLPTVVAVDSPVAEANFHPVFAIAEENVAGEAAVSVAVEDVQESDSELSAGDNVESTELVAAQIVDDAIKRALVECIGAGAAAVTVATADVACMTDWSFLAESAEHAAQEEALLVRNAERDFSFNSPSVIKVSHGRLSLPLHSEFELFQKTEVEHAHFSRRLSAPSQNAVNPYPLISRSPPKASTTCAPCSSSKSLTKRGWPALSGISGDPRYVRVFSVRGPRRFCCSNRRKTDRLLLQLYF